MNNKINYKNGAHLVSDQQNAGQSSGKSDVSEIEAEYQEYLFYEQLEQTQNKNKKSYEKTPYEAPAYRSPDRQYI